MEYNRKQYLTLMSEIISKEMIVLGPDIAILKARLVAGLVVDDNGNVTDIKGNEIEAVQKLVDGYVELSGQTIGRVIDPIFIKYPLINKVNY